MSCYIQVPRFSSVLNSRSHCMHSDHIVLENCHSKTIIIYTPCVKVHIL